MTTGLIHILVIYILDYVKLVDKLGLNFRQLGALNPLITSFLF